MRDNTQLMQEALANGRSLNMVDLTHPFGWDTPGWVGYPGPKVYFWQRWATQGIVSQMIETTLHNGTHIDAAMHVAPGGADMESVPLEKLVGEGVIVDVSDEIGEWDVIRPEHITKKVEVKKGDILIIHTGWHRYYTYGEEPDETKYFCRHPGGCRALAEWFVEMKLRWTGADTGSADHPMNTSIRRMRPDLVKEYEKRMGKSVEEIWPEEDIFVMHKVPFPAGVIHAENVGGDIQKVLNRRCMIGAFPWRFRGGEASICRIIAFPDL